MLLSAGALVGLAVGLALLAGALVAWVILPPALVALGLVHDAAGLGEWLLWPGVGLLCGGGVAAMALEWRSFACVGRDLGRLGRRAALLALAGGGFRAVEKRPGTG